LIERIRDSSVNVLISGESGTGKDLIARALHYSSPRARRPLVALNCAALPETLVETELFGIEKGVATGVNSRMGQFQAADGGSMLELLQYASHPAPATDRATNRPGNGHLCFKVDDVRGACAELKRRGVALISEATEITAGAHTGGWGVYFRDPDGFTVELYQGPPATPAPAAAVPSGAERR